jgi:predicted acetyltransferase
MILYKMADNIVVKSRNNVNFVLHMETGETFDINETMHCILNSFKVETTFYKALTNVASQYDAKLSDIFSDFDESVNYLLHIGMIVQTSLPTNIKLKNTTDFSPEELFSELSKLKDDLMGNSSFTLDELENFNQFSAKYCTIVNDSLKQEVINGLVPSSVFWIEHERKIKGRINVRHKLTKQLELEGGHVGIMIFREADRNKGLCSVALPLAIEKAREIGIKEILITVLESNYSSRRVISQAGGKLLPILNEFKTLPSDKKILHYKI